MPRKRMLSPDIWTDEGFIECSPMARLLFIGLISHADDEGRGCAGTLALKSKIFPADKLKDVDMRRFLDEVIHKLRVRFYAVEGRDYYQLDRWTQHQYVQSKRPSTIPCPDNDIAPSTVPSTYEQRNDNGAVSSNGIEKKGIEKKEKKSRYADYVLLTEEEHAKLTETYGSDATRKAIARLDNYKGSKGKTYKSDYRAILAWVIDALGLQPLAPEKKRDWKCPQCGAMHTSSYKVCACGWGR